MSDGAGGLSDAIGCASLRAIFPRAVPKVPSVPATSAARHAPPAPCGHVCRRAFHAIASDGSGSPTLAAPSLLAVRFWRPCAPLSRGPAIAREESADRSVPGSRCSGSLPASLRCSLRRLIVIGALNLSDPAPESESVDRAREGSAVRGGFMRLATPSRPHPNPPPSGSLRVPADPHFRLIFGCMRRLNPETERTPKARSARALPAYVSPRACVGGVRPHVVRVPYRAHNAIACTVRA